MTDKRSAISANLTKNVLYKYVSPDRILTCIPESGNGTLRATQPLSLNDVFEFHLDDQYSGYEPPIRALYEDYAPTEEQWLSKTFTDMNPATPVDVDGVKAARHEHGSLYLSQLFVKQTSGRFGIVSFSSDPFHPLMWAHYAENTTGFVIGYDKAVLRAIAGGEKIHATSLLQCVPRHQYMTPLC